MPYVVLKENKDHKECKECKDRWAKSDQWDHKACRVLQENKDHKVNRGPLE